MGVKQEQRRDTGGVESTLARELSEFCPCVERRKGDCWTGKRKWLSREFLADSEELKELL